MRSATGLTGSGSRDWIVQRLSAVILAVYTILSLGWILLHPGFDYTAWYGFMMTLPMKIFSLLAILSLVGHAWVGMWTVFTDYITPAQVGPSASAYRLILQCATIVAIIVFMVWGIQIFWAH